MTNEAATATAPVHCCRCDRALRSPKSVARQYGPGCARKIAAAAKTVDLADYKAEQVTKAAQLIADGAIVRTGALYLAVATDGITRYETDPAAGTCSCKAGQHGRRCYHLAGALILQAA